MTERNECRYESLSNTSRYLPTSVARREPLPAAVVRDFHRAFDAGTLPVGFSAPATHPAGA